MYLLQSYSIHELRHVCRSMNLRLARDLKISHVPRWQTKIINKSHLIIWRTILVTPYIPCKKRCYRKKWQLRCFRFLNFNYLTKIVLFYWVRGVCRGVNNIACTRSLIDTSRSYNNCKRCRSTSVERSLLFHQNDITNYWLTDYKPMSSI